MRSGGGIHGADEVVNDDGFLEDLTDDEDTNDMLAQVLAEINEDDSDDEDSSDDEYGP